MPRPHLVMAAVALALAAVLGTAAPAMASSPTPTPSPSASARSHATAKTKPKTPPIVYPTWAEVERAKNDEQAAADEVKRIAETVIALQHAADASAREAQIAENRLLLARTAAADAKREAAQAKTKAAAARALADRSRAQAGALASSLARTDLGTLPLGLVLNSRSASGMLHGLSGVSVLSVNAEQVFRRATADERAAKQAEAVAATAVVQASKDAVKAATAAKAATRKAQGAQAAVALQQAHEKQLVAQLAVVQRTSAQAACDYLAGKQHRPKCGTPGGAHLPKADTPALKAVAYARAHIGDPYVFDTAGPTTYDCSGLTMAAYASVGIDIGPHSATAQYNLLKVEGRLVPLQDVQPGDLLFYTDGGGDMYHTTIYSGDGLMIEAPYEGADVREVPVRTDQLVGQVARPALGD